MIDLLNGDRIKKGVMNDFITNRNAYPISFNGDDGNKLYLLYSSIYKENGKYYEKISDPDFMKILFKAYKLDGKDYGFINFMKREYGLDVDGEGSKGIELDASPETFQ